MVAGRQRARRLAIGAALPLALYLLAAVIVTWPLAWHLNDRAAGLPHGDTLEVTRHIWWAREALLDGANPFDQRLLAYPDGFMSWVQWAHPLQVLPGALLSLAIPPLTAFNILLIVTLVLNGLAAYWLGLLLSDENRPAALLGGLVFLAYPTVQGHLSVGHLGIVTLWPLPLFAGCLWRVLRADGGWWTVGWGALWLALTALAHISHPVYLLVPLIALLSLGALLAGRGRVWRRDRPAREQPWLRAAAMMGAGALLLIPFYGPLLSGAGRAEMRDVAETGRVVYSADALAFASPSPFGWLGDRGFAPDYARDVLGINSAEGTAYVGVVALALSAVAVLRRPSARPWLLVAAGAALLSLGPLLKWRGAPLTAEFESFRTYVTLPWIVAQDLPLLDAARAPGRFNLLTGLAISALVSAGAGVALGWLRRPVLRAAVVVLLGAAVLVEYQLFAPFATDDTSQPAYYAALADARDVRAVLDVPVNDPLVAKIGLYAQTIHGKPLIAGHALRRTPQDPALLALLERAALGGEGGALPALPATEVIPLLSRAGADRVIVHKRFVADAAAVVFRLRAILGAPEYEDALIAAFAVPRDDALPESLVWAAGAGWAGTVTLDGALWSLLGQAGEWHFVAAQPYAELSVPVRAYGAPRRVAVRLDGALIGGGVIGEGTLRLPLWIDAGIHTLRFEALDGCDPYPFALDCLAEQDAWGGACARTEPPACLSAAFGTPTWTPLAGEPETLAVTLDGGLRLEGYALTLCDDPRALDVRLFWAAERALPADYALFVHVADPQTAVPLAQFDGYPGIATSAWRGGARWVSEVRVLLPGDLPPGEVAVNVGWFDPVREERLGVRGDRPWAREGIVHLETVRIGG
ncbi:MAG: hypothetical protein M5U29_15655 [Anaerolineae bacterium]|nr:hypothetical protein [Anaerolineae bacterium]